MNGWIEWRSGSVRPFSGILVFANPENEGHLHQVNARVCSQQNANPGQAIWNQ